MEVTEREKPSPGPGEVRVRVRAAGVLPFDVRVRKGWTPPALKLDLPVVPGNEFAGVVDELGEGVTGFAVGDEVMGYCMLGAYAEWLVVSSEQVVAKPAAMPWEIAAGYPSNSQGARMALEAIGVGRGDTVLIHAAAGGLGTFSVQLAQAMGADTVIGTASETNHDYLRSLGVVPVTYGDGLVERVREVAPWGIDAALDAAGPEALRASAELVENRQRIRTMISFEAAEELGVPDLTGTRSAERLAELVTLHSEGKIKINVRATYSLEEVVKAHRDVESGHGRGKVVLLID
nr:MULTISPECIES: NADP-dependent oxidoreductase [unclassified Actinopolyspora]